MLKRILLCLFLTLIPALLLADTALKIEAAPPFLFAGASGTITFGITDTQTPAPSGHYIYWRLGTAAYNTTNRKDCATSTSCVVAITTPTFGVYHFAGTSYGGGLESPYGTEIDWTNAPLAPTISITSAANGVVAFSITDLQTPSPSGHYIYWRFGTGTWSQTNRKDCLTAASCTVTITSPQFGTYHFVGTAYGGSLESPYSGEIDWNNVPQPPTITITNIAATPIPKGGILYAETNVPTTTKVLLGETANFGSTYTVDTVAELTHSITISNLKKKRLYFYAFVAADGTKSGTYSFLTQ